VKTVFAVPEERERLMKLVRSLDLASAMRDAAHWIRALRAEANVDGPVACMGYCIGGRLAFATAGAHAADVVAAACVHGGAIATDAPDSPHLAAGKIKARLWFGIADNDPSCTPAQQGMLVTALASAHVRFTADHFDGRMHGFAVRDFPVYDEDAAATHWRRIEELFAASFTA
jgi:carboxymethylenebutenolidase